MVNDLAHVVIALDGPSGSGKSSVARELAARLGLRLLDTGAMYRALTWWCLHEGVPLADTEAVRARAVALPLQIGTAADDRRVVVAGIDVTELIRSAEVTGTVSVVAANLGVRAEMRRRQREIIGSGGIVVEGRDITTVVAPDAEVRVLLTASEEARLARRARELHGRVDAATLASTAESVLRRDAADAAVSQFESATDGAVMLDSTSMTLVEVVDLLEQLTRQAVGRG